MTTWPNEIAGANTGLRFGFAEKLLVVLSPRPGVARLKRWTKLATFFNRSLIVGYMRQSIRKCGQGFGFVSVTFALCLSCSRSRPVQESELVGMWQRVGKPAINMTFLKDGTFSVYVAGEHMMGGKYRVLNGEQIVLDYDTSSKTGSATNRAFMSGEEFRIIAVGSEAERYKRVEQQPQ
jgi:hypothetical protein